MTTSDAQDRLVILATQPCVCGDVRLVEPRSAWVRCAGCGLQKTGSHDQLVSVNALVGQREEMRRRAEKGVAVISRKLVANLNDPSVAPHLPHPIGQRLCGSACPPLWRHWSARIVAYERLVELTTALGAPEDWSGE